MNINNPTTFSTPALTLSTTNSSGTSGALRADDTVLVYDTTLPAGVGTSNATGSASTSARRDHVHTSISGAITTVDNNIARYTGTAGALQGYTSGGPVINDTGTITASAQPTVAVYADVQSNVTGDDTVYTVLWANEIWDVGGNFASNTFTAPVGGKYLVTCQVGLGELPAGANQIFLRLVSSNRSWSMYSDPPNADINTSNTKVIDMDTSDTLTVAVYSDGGSKQVDVSGGSSLRSSMTIFKVG